VTVTKNEILAAFNKPQNFLLALVSVPPSQEYTPGDGFKVREPQATYGDVQPRCQVRYVREPFQKEPDFGVSSVNYHWQELWQRGSTPDAQ